MAYLYTRDGKKVFIHHPIDVQDAINSGHYFEKNPVEVKAEIPKPKADPQPVADDSQKTKKASDDAIKGRAR